MKKICIIFLLSIIISLTAFGFVGGKNETCAGKEYLRIHIRADSNDDAAQAVKYRVRDDVVEYLTPYVAQYETMSQAQAGLKDNLDGIERVATSALRKAGFSYGATATLATEHFPTRVYDGYTLPSGEYTALILNLGSGKGDNWWCVVYPPLCFAATETNIVYKSKIKEIIENWSKKA